MAHFALSLRHHSSGYMDSISHTLSDSAHMTRLCGPWRMMSGERPSVPAVGCKGFQAKKRATP
ncbi:MAG: hypothetical protein OJF49_000859 [Ktedonobacterales bacterium]|nr:MAG: hypothetical protein OJF49_000859 [Ktedonobacterales bacterium]